MADRILPASLRASRFQPTTLTERATQPVTVPAAEWPGFPARLEERRVELEAQDVAAGEP